MIAVLERIESTRERFVWSSYIPRLFCLAFSGVDAISNE